jgi:hypothetical protein
VAVEFDGGEHYRHALKIMADREKDELARNGGYRVVRVPYWVQLTTETLCYYFEIDAEIIQNFPHGFIATRFFPASYCELGIARFKRELDALPLAVRNAVVTSLRHRAMEFVTEYVVPNALAHLLDGSG